MLVWGKTATEGEQEERGPINMEVNTPRTFRVHETEGLTTSCLLHSLWAKRCSTVCLLHEDYL